MRATTSEDVRLALPKGRMQGAVVRLLEDAGIGVGVGERDYRPTLSMEGFGAKLLKPRNVIGMLEAGARDVGFAGADWVEETGVELVELLDTGLDPVRLVAAAPESILEEGRLPGRALVVATEYVSLAARWIARSGVEARVLQTFGATEVFPPEDADCLIDNAATGATLRANGLVVVDEVLRSSTRLYANPAAMERAEVRERIEALVMLLRSVLEARRRVMVDLNVAGPDLERVVEVLPCMREPSVARLHEEGWYAVRAAVPRERLVGLIPVLKRCGARDIVTTAPDQIIA